MISRRGWSSSSCSVSELECRSRRSFCRSSRDSENNAVSDPEKNADPHNSPACRTMRTIIEGSASKAVSNAR